MKMINYQIKSVNQYEQKKEVNIIKSHISQNRVLFHNLPVVSSVS